VMSRTLIDFPLDAPPELPAAASDAPLELLLLPHAATEAAIVSIAAHAMICLFLIFRSPFSLCRLGSGRSSWQVFWTRSTGGLTG
jgi:hypothetical protein